MTADEIRAMSREAVDAKLVELGVWPECFERSQPWKKPTTHEDYAWGVESELLKRGMADGYAECLLRLVCPGIEETGVVDLFAVAHAGPLDRCRAAVWAATLAQEAEQLVLHGDPDAPKPSGLIVMPVEEGAGS